MADGNFPEEMDWFISSVMPGAMLVTVAFAWWLILNLNYL